MKDRPSLNPACFLGRFGVHESGTMPPCDGPLVRCHLIPKRLLKQMWVDVHHGTLGEDARKRAPLGLWRTLDSLIWDSRVWVLGCGGPMGNGGHHGELDQSRRLWIPRRHLPVGTLDIAHLLNLEWFLDREYGELVR